MCVCVCVCVNQLCFQADLGVKVSPCFSFAGNAQKEVKDWGFDNVKKKCFFVSLAASLTSFQSHITLKLFCGPGASFVEPVF